MCEEIIMIKMKVCKFSFSAYIGKIKRNKNQNQL